MIQKLKYIFRNINPMVIFLILILLIILIFYNNYIPNYKEYNLYNGNKWGEKKTANAYRFGDIFNGHIYKHKKSDYLRDIEINYPNSFGSKYVKYSGYPREFKENDYDILERIFNEYNYKKPDNKTLVVHLRLGDVLNPKRQDFKGYHHTNEYYYELLKKIKNKDIKKVDIVTGLHKNEYIKESNIRLNEIKNIFEKKYPTDIIITNNPDKDLYYMCHSKYFIKDGGGFSRIASEYVKKKNNIVYTINEK